MSDTQALDLDAIENRRTDVHDIKALIAEIRRLRAEVERLRALANPPVCLHDWVYYDSGETATQWRVRTCGKCRKQEWIS